MADPLNDGADHPGVSGAQGNNVQAPDQQSAQTAVATPHAQGEDSGKKAKVSDSDQGNSNGTLESLTALNLKPEKTIYMLKQTEAILRETQVDRQTCKAHKKSPKFKATSVPFNVLRIGKYEARPQYPSNLIAKWHYSNKRLIWEILENFVMKKIEISWSDISAIRVVYGGNVEILEVELSKPPHFYCETELRPKKHTSWKPSSDFTDGQACSYRRHHLEFPQGKLEKNMEQLFLSDSRLRELTRRPFPSSRSPLFEGYISDAPQPAPHFMNPELVQLPHHLHHPLPPSHSSVPTCLPNDEPMVLIEEYERRSKNNQVLSPGNSLTSQISDNGYAVPRLLPRYGTIFDGRFIGHASGEQIGAPSSYNCGGVTVGTTHGYHGYDHNSNAANMMLASEGTSTSAGMNIIRHAPQSIFNQDMGRCHSGPGSSSNALAIDMPSSSCIYFAVNDHASQGSHERYNNNNEPLMNETRPHHAHAQDRLIATNMMLASNGTSTSAGMNIIRHAPQSIFNQDMGRCHSGPGSSSNALALDMPSSSCIYPTVNDHASHGSHERYNNNNELLMNETRPHHSHGQDKLIATNMMLASKGTSTSAGMNIIRHAPQSIFNQHMGHCHLGPGSSSNALAIDMPSSSRIYPTANDHASQGSHERYNNNNEPLMNETRPHHACGQDKLIYPELVSNHDHHHHYHHCDHRFMADYNRPHFLPSEYMMNVDEVRNWTSVRGDKPPHFLP